jgi:DNA polymerase-3 subunit epsilon
LSALGLEKAAQGRPCFARQLKKCLGACVGHESPEAHALRLRMAMEQLKLKTWPYDSAVGIQEGDDLHLVDRWCYLGTAKSEQEIAVLLARGRPVFDRDSYLVLSKALKTNKVVELTL